MTFTLSSDSLVKDIVNEFPKTSDVFKRNRIDFCCGGNIPLIEAVNQNGLDIDKLREELQAVCEKSALESTDPGIWTNSDTDTIIHHIINHFHRTSEEELSLLSPYVTKVSRVHGERHPELVKVYELFNEFKKELTEHMAKEEEIIFPLIAGLSDQTIEDRSGAIAFIAELEKEHDHAGELLRRIRSVTSDFTLPLDACGTYRLVFKRLEDLEGLTFMHVHFENNILFPRFN